MSMKILNLPIELPQDACCKAWPDQSADLTAYLLDPMAETASRLRPAVVICPGGGYTRLSEREDQPVAMEYLAAGFQVFSLHGGDCHKMSCCLAGAGIFLPFSYIEIQLVFSPKYREVRAYSKNYRNIMGQHSRCPVPDIPPQDTERNL